LLRALLALGILLLLALLTLHSLLLLALASLCALFLLATLGALHVLLPLALDTLRTLHGAALDGSTLRCALCSGLAALCARRRSLRGRPLRGSCSLRRRGARRRSATRGFFPLLRLREARAQCSAEQQHAGGSCDQLPTHLMHSWLGLSASQCSARFTSC
jgi:hypothetical protein